LSFLASLESFCKKQFWHGAYWLFAGLLNLTVQFMKEVK